MSAVTTSSSKWKQSPSSRSLLQNAGRHERTSSRPPACGRFSEREQARSPHTKAPTSVQRVDCLTHLFNTFAVHRTSDLNVIEYRTLPTPADLVAAMPRTTAQSSLVCEQRHVIRRILRGEDPRLLAVVGPCSIHDLDSGREYAQRLATLADDLSDQLVIVMRAYFEKPRTTTGWKGLLLDPHLDGTGDVTRGVRLARQFLGDVLHLGLATATEFLDPISPQYLADLVCWSAIGARTSESQTHRQLASGLSMPVGFKNGTDGNIRNAVNAIKAAQQGQTFLGITNDGRAAAIRTSGNADCHLVLRGGATGPNYGAPQIAAVEALLEKAGLRSPIMVDCSHDNSHRQPDRQPAVLHNVVDQIKNGNRSIIGVMLESNLFAGNQPAPTRNEALRYGVSITDGCLDWAATERCLRETHATLEHRFASPARSLALATP